MKTLNVCLYIVKETLKSIKHIKRVSAINNALERKKEAFNYVAPVCHTILDKIGVEMKINGIENVPKDEQVVFISNHQGNFDILAFMTSSPIPIGFVSKENVEKMPILSKWMGFLGCLFIDRNKGKEAIRKLSSTFKNLDEYGSYVLFPEGTRSQGKTVGPFQTAGIKTALKRGATIVPVTLDGSYLVMEANNNRFKPATIHVTFHPPVKKGDEKEEDVIQALRTTIESGIRK